MRKRFVYVVGLAAALSGTQACRTTADNDHFGALKGLEGCGGTAVEPQFVAPEVLTNLADPQDAKARAVSERLAAKSPVVVYIAVDTDEPFMKLAVDHELHALRTACAEQGAKVNWIALVNSHLTRQERGIAAPLVMTCTAGHYAATPLPPEVAKSLEIKRDLYSRSTTNTCGSANADACLRIVQPFLPAKGAEFRRFPLAHPEILLSLLEYSSSVFPAKHFTYFLHIKSHGSEDFLTTGLGPEQVAEKTKCQADVMTTLHRLHPELFVNVSSGSETGTNTDALGQVGLGQVGLGQVGLGQVGLGQVGLGQVGLGQVGLGQVGLGQVGLGQVGLGKIGGLGLGVAGLGASNHYGSRHLSALFALRWFTSRGTGQEDLGFVFFESCESRASRFLQSASQNCRLPPSQNPLTTAFRSLSHMHAYYSAAQSLWYRNLDWDRLFATWAKGEASVASFQKLMIATTALVPNYNFSSQDPLPLCP